MLVPQPHSGKTTKIPCTSNADSKLINDREFSFMQLPI